ncbi:MAG: Asp-tRNA(Asn)/Glu-tRNA(Gln) amidotransferase subunit GatC [bacterium]|nr:Asp-tRNA(Asn)/Glu-tRNA(Gln) amidotransferase subunit GatC [bacterium]
MISPEDIKKLANLARIRVSEEELPKLSKDIENVLGYVAQLSEVNCEKLNVNSKPDLINVMREDINPHETGIYTEKILANSPRRQGDYFVVKKIL